MEGTTLSTNLAVFNGQGIRKILHNGEWWFSVVDVCQVLTDQPDNQTARKYWNKLSQRLRQESNQLVTFCHQLKLPAADGKLRETDCATTEGLLRIIQSIPSPKAEPFKLWLAKVGYERVQEIENPELAQKRMRDLYKTKGYPDSWIEKRMRGIVIREELTNEWKNRGADEKNDFKILTAEIAKATFDVTPSEHKKLKGLKRENLRDHMVDMELILTMLGEATTSELTKTRDSKGLDPLKKDAKDGGNVAGRTRKDIEKQTGKKIVSPDNFLPKKKRPKKLTAS